MAVPQSWVGKPSPQAGDVASGKRSGRLGAPAGEALLGPFPAAAGLEALIASGRLQAGGGRPAQPGVDRAPLLGRGLLDRGLELLGQAYVDPRGGAVLGDQQIDVRRAAGGRRSVLGREVERLWRGGGQNGR